MISLCRLDIPDYSPDEVPAELAAIPPVKPGSRGLAA
jgi:orotate phosphoribosyltransferase